MLYAILCYHDEDTVGSWSKEQDAAVMKKLAVVQDRLTKQGRLGPVARLLPTTSATTLRGSRPYPDASRPADARQPAARGEGGEVAAFLPCPSAGKGAVLPCGVTFDP
jgi:hypothetical protein